MKKLVAMALMIMLIGASALAEITVQVAKVGGEECYVGIRTAHVALTLDMDTWQYKTAEGLVWQARPIPFGTMVEKLMPRSEGEIRAMNRLYAALADASGFWETPVTGKGRLAVYSAPDETSLRGAGGKAAVELSGGVKLLMTLGDWSLIEYEVDQKNNRIGWVQKTTLGSAPVMFTDIPVTLQEGAILTDAPHGLYHRMVRADETVTDVHLLAQLDSFWGYVKAKTADGQAVWGFVPLREICLTDVVDEAAEAELAGEWRFVGGGNLLPDDFSLLADGSATVGEGTAQWAVVGGTAGYEHDLLLTYADGRVARFHIYDRDDGLLTLTQCEAGGSWQRITE